MALFDGEGAPTVILVTLLGVADHHVEEIVTTTHARFVRSRVVYVTDSLDFMRLRRMGAAFEYLPLPSTSSSTRVNSLGGSISSAAGTCSWPSGSRCMC